MRYQSTTGLDPELVIELVTRIREILESRDYRPGRPRILGLYKEVVLVLILLRQNISQSVLADGFGISQPTVSRIYRALMPLLSEALGLCEVSLNEAVTGRIVLVDGTDVPTGNRTEGKENYSGKRRRQGLSIQVASDVHGNLLCVSDPVPGARHDRAAIMLCDWESVLDTSCWIADPAYISTSAITPMKRPQGQELTDDRKEYNREISAIRSAVERCIAHLKNWKILATGYRGPLRELPTVIRTVTRLELYRLGW